jgi:hypothetical protein
VLDFQNHSDKIALYIFQISACQRTSFSCFFCYFPEV